MHASSREALNCVAVGRLDPTHRAVLLTGHTSPASARDALRAARLRFLTKTFHFNRTGISLTRANRAAGNAV